MIRNADIELRLAKSYQEQLRATWRSANDRTPRVEKHSERPSRPVLLAVWSR